MLAQLLDQGHDLRAYCAELVEYVRNMLVVSVVPSGPDLRGLIEASEEDLVQLARDAERFTVEQLQELFRCVRQRRIVCERVRIRGLCWKQRRCEPPAC